MNYEDFKKLSRDEMIDFIRDAYEHDKTIHSYVADWGITRQALYLLISNRNIDVKAVKQEVMNKNFDLAQKMWDENPTMTCKSIIDKFPMLPVQSAYKNLKAPKLPEGERRGNITKPVVFEQDDFVKIIRNVASRRDNTEKNKPFGVDDYKKYYKVGEEPSYLTITRRNPQGWHGLLKDAGLPYKEKYVK